MIILEALEVRIGIRHGFCFAHGSFVDQKNAFCIIVFCYLCNNHSLLYRKIYILSPREFPMTLAQLVSVDVFKEVNLSDFWSPTLLLTTLIQIICTRTSPKIQKMKKSSKPISILPAKRGNAHRS